MSDFDQMIYVWFSRTPFSPLLRMLLSRELRSGQDR
jgi:hypothetical protein